MSTPTSSEQLFAAARSALRWYANVAGRQYGPAPGAPRPPLRDCLGDAPFFPQVGGPLTALMGRINDDLGDGSRTAVLIAAATVEAILPALTARKTARAIAKALRKQATETAEHVDILVVRATSLEEVRRAATTAAQGREDIGVVLAESFRDAGRDGIINVSIAEDGPPVRAEQSPGKRFPFPCPWEGEWDRDAATWVFVSTAPFTLTELHTLDSFLPDEQCVCLCPEVDKTALVTAIEAYQGGLSPLVPIAVGDHPRWRELCEDFAVLAGATYFDPAKNPAQKLTFNELGFGLFDLTDTALIMLPDNLTLDDDWQNRFNSHVARLREVQYASSDQAEREWLAQRLCVLDGSTIEVLVHGATQEESAHLHDLTCSAMHATRAFIADGFVPGGGVAYLHCAVACTQQAPATDQGKAAAQALARGLETPFRLLCERAGKNPALLLRHLDGGFGSGFDVLRGGLVHFPQEGPLDAVRIVKGVITAAAEAAAEVILELSKSLRRDG